MDMKQLVRNATKTRLEICTAVGISRAHLSMIEAGKRQVGIETIAPLAKVLGVRPSELRPDLAAIFDDT